MFGDRIKYMREEQLVDPSIHYKTFVNTQQGPLIIYNVIDGLFYKITM